MLDKRSRLHVLHKVVPQHSCRIDKYTNEDGDHGLVIVDDGSFSFLTRKEFSKIVEPSEAPIAFLSGETVVSV